MKVNFGVINTGHLNFHNLYDFMLSLSYGRESPTEIVGAHKTIKKLLSLLWTKEEMQFHQAVKFFGATVCECSEIEEGVLEFINANNNLNPKLNGRLFLSEEAA